MSDFKDVNSMQDELKLPEGLLAKIERLVDGAISAEETTALERALDGSPAAQKVFFDYCQLHVALDQDARTMRVVDGLVGNLPTPRGAAVTPPPPVADAPAAPTGIFGAIASQADRSPGGWSVGAFGLICLAALVVVVAWPRKLPEPAGKNAPNQVVKSAPIIATERTPSLTSVQLDTGATRLALDNIGSVIVEGPADFQLLGPNRARLNRGRIKVHITEPAGLGFVVETPAGEVTDLGTEFGLNVANDRQTGLVVFQGAVDLRVPEVGRRGADARVERLVEGDGVLIDGGQLNRIMSIVTGDAATFHQCGESNVGAALPTIVDVSDNLRADDTKKFYEIVPGGFRDGARSYVDRPLYDWRWVAADGRDLPEYLVGADYVKPFNSDKMRRRMEIEVTLSRPARLFVIFDNRLVSPDWLFKSFRDTGDFVGIRAGQDAHENVLRHEEALSAQLGQVARAGFSVWECIVPHAGKVKLGSNSAGTAESAMYGIAAVPFDVEE